MGIVQVLAAMIVIFSLVSFLVGHFRTEAMADGVFYFFQTAWWLIGAVAMVGWFSYAKYKHEWKISSDELVEARNNYIVVHGEEKFQAYKDQTETEEGTGSEARRLAEDSVETSNVLIVWGIALLVVVGWFLYEHDKSARKFQELHRRASLSC